MKFVRCLDIDDKSGRENIVYINLSHVKVIHREERSERATIIETFECSHEVIVAPSISSCIHKFKENEVLKTCTYGEWRSSSLEPGIYCSVCGKISERFYKYCPECGSDMTWMVIDDE